MKKTVFLLSFILGVISVSTAQTAESPWGVGVKFGANQYHGEVGHGFFRFDKGFNPMIGINASRYINRFLDATIEADFGTVGYSKDTKSTFHSNLFNVNANARFKFLGNDEHLASPYIMAGLGYMRFTDKNNSAKKNNMALPTVGAGVVFRVTPLINIEYQMKFIYSDYDRVDNVAINSKANDAYLQNSIGVTFNLGKKKQKPVEDVTLVKPVKPVVKKEVEQLFNRALKDVQFETGKDVITESSYELLDKVVIIMNDNTNYKLEINGHTDNTGSYELNKNLSEKRAIAVKNYLIEKGVDSERINTNGYGPDKPIDTNDTPEGRANNRRVEFKVVF